MGGFIFDEQNFINNNAQSEINYFKLLKYQIIFHKFPFFS